MKKLFSILAATAILTFAGCSGEGEEGGEEPTEETVNVEVEWNVPEGTELAVADIAIEGMSCEMNCVNKVNGSLSDLDGVASCDIDFDSERDVDHATVTFDPSKVTEADLINAVQGVADGAYSINSMSVEAAAAGASANETDDEGETVELNDNTSVEFSFPNIIELFYSLF